MDVSSFWLSVLRPNMKYSTHEYSTIYNDDNTISVSQAKIALKFLTFSELVYGKETYPRFSIARTYEDISTGFGAKVYINGEEAILVFRGSELSLQDWVTNGQHSSNLISEQYLQAISLAKTFNQEFSSYKKTVTGYSLGGGLAIAASVAFDIESIVFNATGINTTLLAYIHQEYYENSPEKMKQVALNITSYNFEGEFVSDSDNQQDADVAGDNVYQIGTIYYITNQRFTTLIPLLKNSLSLHFTQPLAEELDLLSTQECRTNPENHVDFNNHINKNSLNKLIFPCWKDKTLDDLDITNWIFKYIFNDITR